MKWVKYLVFSLIGLLLLFLAFNNQSPKELLAQLQNVNYFWIILSMLFGFLAMVSRGVRWNVLLENMNYQPSNFNSICAVTIGYVTNLAIPRAGEVTRCTSLAQTEKIPIDKLLGTIILERIIDFICLVLLICTVFLLNFNAFKLFFIDLFTDGVASTTILYIITSIPIVCFLLFFLFKNYLKTSSFYNKVLTFLKGVRDGIKSISGLKRQWAFWGHTLFIWAMYYLMTYVCFFTIEETKHLNIIDGLFILVVGGLGMIAPVQGGIGAYHLVVKTGLVILGINSDSAILFATIVHAAQTLMTLFVGSCSVLLLFLSKRNNPSEHI
mgnify:CR=1 FL=1